MPTSPSPEPIPTAPAPPAPTVHRGRPGSALRVGAVALDAIAVLVFVGIGRHTHDHGVAPAGVASTAWPFLVGLAVGWAVLLSLHRDATTIRSGAAVCVVTVAVGMLLRVVAGQGTAFAFVLVALSFLGALMVGWRAIVAVIRRRGEPGP